MGQPFTIESLMAIAAIGALFIGAAEEAVLVVFLFAVGEVLEDVAAGVEAGSSHPPAVAITDSAMAAGAAARATSGGRNIVGKRAEAQVDGAPAWVDSLRFAQERGVMSTEATALAETLEAQGKSLSVGFREGRALGLAALRDEPKPDAVEGVRQLRALGLKAVFLVTSVLGITGLWIAILADTGATVLVTMNALRLLRLDPTKGG